VDHPSAAQALEVVVSAAPVSGEAVSPDARRSGASLENAFGFESLHGPVDARKAAESYGFHEIVHGESAIRSQECGHYGPAEPRHAEPVHPQQGAGGVPGRRETQIFIHNANHSRLL